MVGCVLRGRATIGEDIPCLLLTTARDTEEAGILALVSVRFAFPVLEFNLFALACPASVPDEVE